MTNSVESSLPVIIREFSPEYAEEIGRFISTIQREEFQISVTLEQQPDLADISGYYQQGKGNFWIALSNSAVVGTISLLDTGNDQVALRKMFVHPDFRGSYFGTASKLLQEAFQWCRTKGIREIYLGTTAKFLAAHRFYEKNGFQEISRGDLPEAFPVMSVDSKFYKMLLSEVAK